MAGRTRWATAHYDTPQKSVRNPDAIMYVVIHHAATLSLSAVVAMEMGTKQVSSTVVIKDEQVVSMMDEFYRAWSLSSAYWDSVSLSSETCNSGGAEQGWPISEASYLSLARVVADWCTRYGIPCNRERVMGHREIYVRYGASYATACPGGIDLDRVVREANAIINGTVVAPERKRPIVASALIFDKGRPAGNGDAYTYNAEIPDAPIKQVNFAELASIQGLGVDAIGVPTVNFQELLRQRGQYVRDNRHQRLVQYSEASKAAEMKRTGITDSSAYIEYEGYLVYRPN